MSSSAETIMHSKLPLSKGCLLTLALTPLLVFVATMGICVGIVQRNDNLISVGGTLYRLNQNIFDSDISAYGIGTPEHYWFATGFTVLSLLLCVLMYFRYALWTLYDVSTPTSTSPLIISNDEEPNQQRCVCGYSFNAVVLAVGWFHAPALILMGWTNGKWNQYVHFPAALVGLGTLEVYCVLNFFLSIQVLKSQSGDTRMCALQKRCLKTEVGLLAVISLLVPYCIVQWIRRWESLYEWMAVFLLILSTLPDLLNFWAIPSHLCSASILCGTKGSKREGQTTLDNRDSALLSKENLGDTIDT